MKKIYVFLVFLFLVGCISDQITLPAPTPNTISTIELLPTETSVPPTQILTPTQPISEIKTECINITPGPQKRSGGIIVLHNGINSRLVFLDNETRSRRYVPDDPRMKVLNAYVSPDGKWLMYQLDWGDPNGEGKFIFTRADGIQQKERRDYGDWMWSDIYWLNNNTLRVAETGYGVTYIDNFAFDPFAGTKTPLRADLPLVANNGNIDWSLDQQAYQLGIITGTNLVYDPTLTRVLYPKISETVSLFNLETNREIVRKHIPGWGRLPKWSLDGKYLAIVGSLSAEPRREDLDEFLMISRDGPEFKQLTYLTNVFEKVRIEEYSWSPDGVHIAFWLKTDNKLITNEKNQFELAIIDVQTAAITKYCITGISKEEIEAVIYSLPIIWSPDGTHLLLTRYKDNDNKQTEVIALDILNKTAYEVAENMQPIGWMTLMP